MAKQKMDFSKLKEAIRNLRQDIITDLVDYLSNVGEAARNAAVDWRPQKRPYTDRTRHLRGSIGYIITVNGKVVKESDFGADDSPEEAKAEGKLYARSLASQFPEGCALIIVAGKKYASYVANRGYDVLDSALVVMREMGEQVIQILEDQLDAE